MHATRHGQPGVVRLAVFFYAGAIGLAWLWGALAGRPEVLFVRGAVGGRGVLLGVALGTALGVGVVALSRLMVGVFDWARDLYRWFAAVLGPLDGRQAALLALLSAVGEEALFRGAMQPSLGLWWTSAIFALCHLPPRARYAAWTVTAALLGLAFGALAERTANLAGPVLAHFIINWLNLAAVGRLAKICPAPEAPPSMPHATPSAGAPGGGAGPRGGESR